MWCRLRLNVPITTDDTDLMILYRPAFLIKQAGIVY